MSLEALFGGVSPATRAILERALEGRDVGVDHAAHLLETRGTDLAALALVADELRRRQVGDRVTYVVNRNINFTNVCVKTCQFCAFSRDLRSEEGYFLDIDEVVRRATQAAAVGATEVCVQAGLAPSTDGTHYIELARALARALPDLHLHAFSPEEVRYGSLRAKMPVRDYLAALIDAGVDSLPGTSAEILDDRIRDAIAPGRLTTAQWIEIVQTAHELGLPTTSTMMFGHVESARDQAAHMELLRRLQRETGGFTEFVPLSFVHTDAPMFAALPGCKPGPTGDDVVRTYATARVVLGADIPNLQASWVKEGIRTAQRLLSCGANDLGGTLINESISTAAGSRHGQLMTPGQLRRAIWDAGRVPAQRRTTYELVREFPDRQAPADDPLDRAAAEVDFGDYVQLTRDPKHRYHFQR